MKNYIPKAAVVSGITGFGRSSLSVVIPVLSAMGIQACPMPTAILSSHPAGFENYSFYEMTDQMKRHIDCWRKENIEFDCIYSGFLGSAQQIDLVLELISESNKDKDPLVIIDPVMGDNGSLYKITDKDIKTKMRSLIAKADVITPNLTEACFLLGENCSDEPLDTHTTKHFLERLCDMGPKNSVITGIKTADGDRANFGYSKACSRYWKVSYEHIPAQYPGTGDIFTSALAGYLLKGLDLPKATAGATAFVTSAVRRTYEAKTPAREGVLLESMLSELNKGVDENPHLSFIE